MAVSKKYIRIRRGRISVNDRVSMAIAALKFVLGLHVCGALAVPLFAAAYHTLNAWLIAAVGLSMIGMVSTVSSLGAIVRLSGNVGSRLRHAWAEHSSGMLVSNDILSYVAPLYPRLLDPGPIFGLFSAIFLAAAWSAAAIGILISVQAA